MLKQLNDEEEKAIERVTKEIDEEIDIVLQALMVHEVLNLTFQQYTLPIQLAKEELSRRK